ncbi:helix-turn-helix domain-containing protein [Embleya scabrispora]|uniref:helix-turn-helix domain-containing protein n=1 Tax=Embleya scabrispora TaxID=159449 RepID=UPI000367DE93|nr:pyridoxamine 5'-phosphate oxidase family protein [Embleya scabrispora]MYS87816.1 helix-turn-helix domain-containing protein [Streptomyces sp. SID5474]
MHDETAGTLRPDHLALAVGVRSRRRGLGLTLRQLARHADLPVTWLEELEAGSAPVSHAALASVAGALGTSAERLLSGAVDAPPNHAPTDPSTPAPDTRELVVMTEEECRARLLLHEVGRVAPAMTPEPFVLPVDYLIDRGDVVFRSVAGSHPAELVGRVAFEVDDLIRFARWGWSVLIIGDAEPVTDPTDVDRLTAALPPTWSDGTRELWTRIHPGAITGRRLRPRLGGD